MSEYTDFSLEDVLSGEARLRHQTFCEVQYELFREGLRTVVMDALREAYDEIVKNEVNEFGDYQKAKVVGPTNKAREAIYSKLPAFSTVLGCITPTETSQVTVDFYALAGGKDGLYLIADVKGLRDIAYRFQYPVMAEADPDEPVEEDTTVQFKMICNGCEVQSIESYSPDGSVISQDYPENWDGTTQTTVEKGTYLVYTIVPKTRYTFTSLEVNSDMFVDMKRINDQNGLTLGERTDGYEFVVTNTYEDRTFVFSCDYDHDNTMRDISITTVKCSGHLVLEEKQLPFIASPEGPTVITCNNGAEFSARFVPDAYTKLSSVMIDGRDYIDEYIEGKMFVYRGRTPDEQEFRIEIGTDTNEVTITFESVQMIHFVHVEYENVQFLVDGYIQGEDGVIREKFMSINMSYYDEYESTGLATLLETDLYSKYVISRFIVRNEFGNAIGSDKITVDYNTSTSRLAISKPTCNASVIFILKEKPKTAMIIGEAVNAGIFHIDGDEAIYTPTVTVGPIEHGKTAVFRIQADPAYYFRDDMPNFGATIIIDGEESTPLLREEAGVELVRVNDHLIVLGFISISDDHTFRIVLGENNLRPTVNVSFTGSNTVNRYESQEDSQAVAEFETTVVKDTSITRVYKPAAGYTVPFANGGPDMSKIGIIINGITMESPSIIPTTYGDAKAAVSIFATENTITVTLSEISDDSTVYVSLSPETKIPETYDVSVSAINECCTVNGQYSISDTVVEGSDFTFRARFKDNELPPTLDDDALDFDRITITINGQVITADNWPTNFSCLPFDGGFDGKLTNIETDYLITLEINYPEPPPPPVKHTVNVIATHATVNGDNPVEVNDGDDHDIVIDADFGTTFENVMFILDKDTENQASWVIDMNTDSFNIFDKEVEGVPQIDNDGTVVRTRADDHYVYTVHLKNIENDYEIRFSTVTIDVGQ